METAVPDTSDGEKWVVVLTYQRCGSTFFGRMFNTNPSVFYMFEPLDALYSSLYGTRPGWNVPSDITTYSNGSLRVLPGFEVREVSRYLASLLSCDVNSLPTHALLHTFWRSYSSEFTTAANYSKCVNRKELKLEKCYKSYPWYCGYRSGELAELRQPTCTRVLKISPTSVNDSFTAQNLRKAYSKHQACLMALRTKVERNCTWLLRNACTNTRVRAVKVVRATMSSMSSLLTSYPQLHVIHLIRDPRAVAISRFEKRDRSFVGRFALTSSKNESHLRLIREASVYCRTVVADIELRRQLEELYPDRVMAVDYEDLVSDLRRHVDHVYRFLDLDPPPTQTAAWIQRNTNTSRSTRAWMRKLSVEQNFVIVHDVCREFFRLVGNKWPTL